MDLETPRYAGIETTDSVVNLRTTTIKIKRVVEQQLELLMTGQIPHLSEQTKLLMDRLVSISGYLVSATPFNQVSDSPPPVAPLSFAHVAATPKVTSLTASDVRRLPRLDGSPDVDVAAVFSQFRPVAGSKPKTVRPNDEEHADSLP